MADSLLFIDVLMGVWNGHFLDRAYHLFSFQGLRFRSGGNGVLHGDSDFAQSKYHPLRSLAFACTASTVLTWICICFACFCLLWVYENMLDMLHDILLPTLGVVFRL